ncbi:unnamed protein product [Nyctereutes procyonoides]|uniref:Olfactory receptor n=1 Tax=Nyctereutes procyonoides TaxID=34880 RepID=A0A811YYN8_NYCPR|nr:unnamed protein product [Nyctereutes procyonoides]
MENQNNVTEFVFMGLWENKQAELLFFLLFLLCYLAILMGNFIILLTIIHSHLIEQPIPQTNQGLRCSKKNISYNNCMTQLFTAHLLAGVEIFILVSMALDRYVAIVKPLHYMVIMNRRRCNLLIFMAWGVGFWHSVALLLMVLNLPFCGPNQIDHYICDVKPLLKLVCRDIRVVNILVISNARMVVVAVFLVLVASYILILYNLRTHSSVGRRKALSTCSSHVMVVIVFFVPCIYIYVLPAGSENKDKEISVFYTVIAPLLNPLIYTLRNMEMRNAMWKVWSKLAHMKFR